MRLTRGLVACACVLPRPGVSREKINDRIRIALQSQILATNKALLLIVRLSQETVTNVDIKATTWMIKNKA